VTSGPRPRNGGGEGSTGSGLQLTDRRNAYSPSPLSSSTEMTTVRSSPTSPHRERAYRPAFVMYNRCSSGPRIPGA